MLRAGFRGLITCWRDVLHERPVATTVDRLRQPVSDVQLRTAARAWRAFRLDDPPLSRTLGAADFLLPASYSVADEFNRHGVVLTTVGRDMLGGRRDWLTIKPLHRWYGGNKLSPSNVWRGDGCERTLVRDRWRIVS